MADMSARKGGTRRKTRHKWMKAARAKGKISVTKYFQELHQGDNVVLCAESSVHEGLYHPRFHGKQGEVAGKQGACYYVQILDGGKGKKLLVHPIHLVKVSHGQTASD